MSAPALAEFQAVSKVYKCGVLRRKAVTAVEDASFRIEPSEVFGLVGPNRAGKTTLVKVLLSLCRPTRGQALRFGRPVAERATLARVGYMHENHALPRYLTAAGLLEYYGAMALVPREDIRRRVPALLERVQLASNASDPIARFSKGMVQRLALAQALINEPELLVLDEPSEGLDLGGRRLLREIVSEQRRRGGSVLLVSHVLSEMEKLCDRVGVLVGGRLVYLGSISSLTRTAAGTARPLEHALQDLYKEAHPV